MKVKVRSLERVLFFVFVMYYVHGTSRPSLLIESVYVLILYACGKNNRLKPEWIRDSMHTRGPALGQGYT